ncbi:right-handed parallel beta-helix repeat-containing protein [Hymenobacter sp. ASUV-10]|uniref:Right-handed parallel beta-helix repeat-containing protein n=1 Tax=Hymenobacter aranciens TaxID=3063996 RepID=A0ABT9B817_9BACT|nr:right-handed parallel beta-helix repeat-containing protein [Hymenobacter sp. ASUV-10]MDO7874429.1 right-handed parallel beta-helix repeat-containing protein [Hymenobacter sp. ASUV-10]
MKQPLLQPKRLRWLSLVLLWLPLLSPAVPHLRHLPAAGKTTLARPLAVTPDTDRDGIPDATEGTGDPDGDGRNNSNDLDSDNDGIPDAVEANNGVLAPNMSTDGQYSVVYVTANDTDLDGLVNARDADNGGTPFADTNQDGDGFVNRLDRDSDNDGLTDAREANAGALRADINTNGFYATLADTDNDGIYNNVDPNNGGTALPLTNTDGTGLPDFLDLDSDDDGATDWYEAQPLVTSNGTASPWIRVLTNTDTDNDGLLADVDPNGGTALVPVDTDGDGTADYRDTDTDNDGVSDRIEWNDDNHDGTADVTYATTDTDGDGIVDVYDSESNTGASSGFNNLVGAPTPAGGVNDYGMKSLRPNADFDYLLDWRDTDDDNDGILTSAEAVAGNYLVYTQGGYVTQRSYGTTPVIVNEPDYLHMKRSGSLAPDKRTAVLDWNYANPFDGSAGGNQPNAYLSNKSFTFAGVTVAVDNFRTAASGTNPITTTINQAGTPPQTTATQAFGALTFNKNPILETDRFLTYGTKLNPSFFQTLSSGGAANGYSIARYTFSQPLRDVTVGLMDVDYGAGAYEDDVEIIGYLNGTAVTLGATDITYNTLIQTNSSAGGSQRFAARNTVATVPSKQQAANISVSFAVPINELRIIYRNANSLTGVQIVSLSEFRATNPDFDGDNVADATDLDTDNDGIPDLTETGGVNVFADADNDGIPNYLDSNTTGWVDANTDGVDDRYDRDLDGLINPMDRDADNDGISDTREAGGSDANGDGIQDGFVDANSDGQNDATAATPLAVPNLDSDTLANYLDIDSDNDGITDAREARITGVADANNNGVADAYALANPDLNLDGIADAVVTTSLPADFDGDTRADYADRDSDNDGITDVRESGGTDANGDGVVDGFADGNGDGLNGGAGNVGVTPGDFDADTFANYLDRDSDNDGITDAAESYVDATNNGISDAATTDVNNDGLYDAAITATLPRNSDGNGGANYLDRDADDDGLVDAIEGGGADANGDGVVDSFVTGSTSGVTNTISTPVDTDTDGFANYVDRDSDSDGIWDLLEIQATTGRRALANADADGDGIDNNFDNNFTAGYAITTLFNKDATDTADYLDQNSDNDAAFDWTEGFDNNDNGYALDDLRTRATNFVTAGGNSTYYPNATDANLNGIPDWLDDADADNIPNFLDFGNTYYRDSNNNGLVDLYDPASSGVASTTPTHTGDADAIFRTTGTVAPLAATLSGTVFEDLNFGGGAGRSMATANAVTAGSAVGVGTAGTPATAATVELYDASGNFVATTQTSTTAGTLGQYSFSVAPATSYTVRVVNSTVRSTRTGSVAGLVPVQTYNGTTTKVGGQAPEQTDAAANTSATLASLTTGSGLTGITPQSIFTLTTGASASTGVDFGFNFDLVVNTRNAGQGSLRQFILNSNALSGETTLAQAGSNAVGTLPAQRETSIFMIPDGSARAGQLAGLASGLTSGVAVITPATALPAISGPNTSVDGSTQTFNINNSNNVTLGAGGTVGTTAATLGTVNGPEVQLVGTTAVATGIDIASGGTGAGVYGLAIYGFGTNGNNNNSGGIRVGAGGATISRNVIGTNATAFADLGAGVRGVADGIRFTGGSTASTVSNNLIGYNGGKGIGVNSATSNVTVTNNEVRSNAKSDANWDGLDFEGTSNSATFNLFIDNAGQGVDTYNSTGSNTITDNTVSGNGRGIASGPGETPGIRIYGNSNTVSRNVISGNYGAGVLVNNTSATTVISQNSIFNNGTVTAVNGAVATGQIGIDLNNGNVSTGVSPFVTLNDSGDSDGGANGLLNYPVLTTAYLSGSNLVVTGYARPGSLVEFFVPGADPTGFGEGQTYLGAATEGTGADTNGGSGTYGPGNINGRAQGTDNTNLFTFSIPLTGPQLTAVQASGLTSTATLSGATSEFSGNLTLSALTGNVFEDINYGGGAGRSIATANGVTPGSAVNVGTAGTPATAATVELYDASGNFLATTQTSTTAGTVGQYSFNVAAGSYQVRVVNSTVRSTRTGTTAGLLPVQTYNGSTTSVGGRAPERTDAAANSGSQTLAALTTGTGLTGFTAQSVASVTASGSTTIGPDFGFNFDLVVNTRDAGQGSLRQFITNANTLTGEASLAQAGSNTAGTLPAQRETSIFMIPNAAANAGQAIGLVSGLTSNVAVITPATALPQVTGVGTIIDGTTQTQNIANSNATTLGTGSTVGTAATALSQVAGPEVRLSNAGTISLGLDFSSAASNSGVRGLSIYGFGNGTYTAGSTAEVKSAASGFTLAQNVIGSGPTAVADPAPAGTTRFDLVYLTGANATVSNNLLVFGTDNGVNVAAGATTATISNNEINNNGRLSATASGVVVAATTATINGNLLTNTRGAGVDLVVGGTSATVTNNTVSSNGRGTTTTVGTTGGIQLATTGNTISTNSITGNYGAGIAALAATGTSTFSQNSISANGTVTANNGTAATGGIGIDLDNNGVTINDLLDLDNGANGRQNFSVIETAYFSGSNLIVNGFAQPGAVVEFFIPAADPTGFGEGQTFLASRTEGSGTDTGAGTGTYTNPVNGLNQGTETTNRFTFSIPLTAAQQAAVLASGLTSTATVGGATSEFSGNTALVTLRGTVFEDPNYGGGSGRSLAASSGVPVGTAGDPTTATTVELYDASGNIVATTTTSTTAGSLGQYTFSAAPGSYTVRVASNTVRSSRPGSVAGLLPVQTFRTNNGAADVNRVGGEAPEKADAVTTGPQTLSFTGGNGAGDNTAFVDLVEILDASNNVVAGLPLNASFETPSLGTSNSSYQYNISGANWTFNSRSGIAANGSAFDVGGTNPVAPDGTQVALVQTAGGLTGSFSQGLGLSPGNYTVRFRAAQRLANSQSLTVAVNGIALGTFTPGSSAYTTYTTGSFTVGTPTTLASLNTATSVAQSIAPLTLTSTGATGIDFGYNFSTVVNTNDAGQGSLRQFLTNSNALTNTGLDQVASSNGGIDPAAGKEYSIFMISDGAAHAGLRSGLTNQLTGASGSARAVITLPGTGTLLVSDANTVVYGQSQTLNVGDTNTGTLGNGGTVGVDALTFNAENKPEVEIAGNNVAVVMSLTGTAATLQGLAVRGGTSQTISINGSTGFLLQNNIIGSSATAFTWANDGTVSGGYGVNIFGGANGSILDNLIGFTGNSGVNVNNGVGASLITVRDNEFTQNGYTSAGGDGISLGDGGGAGPLLIEQNLFTRSNSSAVQFEIGGTSSTTVRNNTIVSAGRGGAGFALSQLEGSAICYLQRNGTNRTRAGVTDLIEKNIIVDTQASGIVIGYGSQNTVISQNSIYNSGSVAIDFNTNPNAYVNGAGSGAVEYGSGDGVTINDGNDPATAATSLANKGVDYPVLTTIDLAGSTLTVTGFSRPGAVIEFFIPELDPTRFGEGRTYLATRTEGVSDLDAGTGSYGPGAINGVMQGTDAAANRFRFTISVAGLTPAQLTQLQNVGVTSTATLLNSTSEFSPNVPFSSDVLATITAGASPIASGQTATFNVTFNNIGGSTASGIVASVQLPAGLSGVSVTGGGSYNSTTGLVSYAGITTLNPVTPVTSTITYTQPINSVSVTGVAAVSTTTNQNGATANDSQSATIVTGPAFDLLTTLGGPASTVANQLTTYTVTTQNNGPGAAPNAVQTVSFATTAALSSVFVSNGGTYSFSGGTSTFTFPVPASLPQGQVVNNFFSFQAPATGPLNLTASVTPNTTGAGELNTANNTATLSTTVSPAPATLANVYTTISSNATNGSAAPAAAVTYTVTQGNNGPSAATGVVTQVALSPNLTTTGFTVNGAAGTVSGSNINFTITGGTATYSQTTGLLTLPTIATQASSASTSYTVVAPAPNSGQLTVTSSVSATTADPVPADNEAATTVTVNNALTADLATTIVGPSTATAGQSVTYTVTTANNGPGTAQNVVQTVNIPAGLPITGANAVLLNGAAPTSTSGTTATYAGGLTYNAATGVVTIANPTGVGAPGTAASTTISYLTPVNNGGLTNVAVVRGTSPDGVTTNNTASVLTTVQTQADVAVYISGPTSSSVGSPITFAVTTVNNGLSISNSETTTVQLPSGLTGVEVRGYDGTVLGAAYNSTSGVVTFPTVTNQAVGGAGTVVGSITFNTPNTTIITPSATAAVGSNVDPNLGNNVASISVGIVPATTTTIDLAATFNAAPPATATAGASISFTVRGANATATATTGVVQDVFLNAGLTTTGFTVGGSAGTLSGDIITFPGGATYSQTTGVLSLPLGNLAASTGVNTAIVQPAPGIGPYAITSTIRGNDTDTNTGNNRVTSIVNITPSVDVATTVTGPASAAIGSTVSYAVVTTNNGPSPASNVVQTVTLPAGVLASSVVITGGGTLSGSTVTFPTINNMAVGANGVVSNTVSFTVPNTTPSITVTGNVTATGDAGTTGNNVSSQVTTTQPNRPPVAADVVNVLQTPEGNTAVTQLPISPLQATDADGNATIVTYTVTSIPNAGTQGTLYYDNAGTYTAVAVNQTLTATQATTLRFTPVTGYVGNVFFNYTATDNGNGVPANVLTSSTATYTIQVGQDNPAVYALTPVKGGTTNPYANNDILASVIDPNGAQYTSAGLITYNATTGALATGDNGTRTVVLTTGPLPAGTTLNAVTGLITVTDYTVLVPGSYPLTITTTDVFGGVTVHNIVLVIGGSPIAVDDFATTNLNTAVTFAVAANDLANGGAAIAPATIDLDPNTAGIQTSITTALGTFTTVGAPVGSVTFTPASATFTGTATTPYVISNSATPAAVSNQANLVVTVRGPLPVDLSTTIAAGTNPVNAGASETLTVTATNNSTTTASPSTVVTVQLPAGLTTTGFTVAGNAGTLSGSTITFPAGTYNQTTGLLTFASTTLAASTTQSIAVVFPAPAASFTATSQIGNGTTDPTPANNVASVNVTVTPQFDLVTSLSGPASVVTGDLATYIVVSRNNGPSAVANAVQTVQLPTGLSGVFITGGGYYNATASSQTLYYVNGLFTTTNPGGGATAYTLAAGGVIFPPASLSSGQALANSISFAPTATFSPSALLTPNTTPAGETNTTNNTGYLNGAATLTAVTVTGATTNQANVYLTVSGPVTIAAGATATYTVTQGNNGPNPAANVTTTVSLPTGLSTATLTLSGTTGTSVAGNVITFTGGANNGATYNTQTGVLTLPTLGTQASAATPQSYTIGITAPATGTYNVTGNVATTTSDPVPGDNVASVMTTIAPAADVAIGLSGPASATAGQPVSYAVLLTNNSGIASSNVTASLNLPAGLSATDLRVGGATGTLSSTTITFPDGSTYNTTTGLLTLNTLATLPANGSQSTAIVFTAPATTGSLSLTGTVSATTPDGVLANNRSTFSTTLTATADVVVAVAGPTAVTTGNPVTYTVTTTNNGPSVAGSETTTVQLPTGLSGVVVRDNTGTIVAGAYNATTGLVTFATVTNLLPGQANAQTGTITFVAPATVRLNVAAIASVPGTNGDPNLDNNQATAVTTVTPASATTADVAVTLVPNLTTQTADSPVVYTLTTQNNTSANPATSVVRTVSLPAGLSSTTLTLNGTTSTSTSNGIITFTGGPNNGATYNVATGVLTLPTLASLVNGTPVVTTITVMPANGPLVAAATVAGANTDPNITNNTAQATNVTITPSTDVATYLTAPASAAVGSTVSYTVVTANNGPSNVASLTQTVNLPAGATGITAPVGASIVGTTVTYTVSNLSSGSSQTNVVTFVMPNVASAAGTASVPTTNDAATANNTASATTARPNQAPVAQDVVNTLQSPEGNTANAPLPISPLNAADADGSVASYTVLTLPSATQGVLYVWNGTANVELNLTNFPGLVLTPTQASNMRFDPAATFAGTVNFSYQATDNLGAVSNPGRYTIQSGIDNASVYATTPVKTNTNTNPYVTNDVLAYVIDPNGAAYNSSALVYNTSTGAQQPGTSNGLAPAGTNAVLAPSGSGPVSNPTNALPSGISLNPATGQIFVSNAAALPAITTSTNYSVNITTTDVYGGVTTQTVTFTLGAYPLPVELTKFTAEAVRNVDGLLRWTTASEKNNDHFDVERSLDGRTFAKISEVKGQGSKATPTDYALTDANAAKLGALLYYRLKQVDVDGTSSYSPVRTISFTKPTVPSISLWPNPAVGATNLDLRQLPTGTYEVSIIDATGRTIVGLKLDAGLTHKVDLREVADGTYTLLLRGRSQDGQTVLLTKRLIKQ